MDKGLWKDIIKIQYNNIRSLNNMSPFWREVVKELYIFNISVNKKNREW
jgi:hypothetical protein